MKICLVILQNKNCVCEHLRHCRQEHLELFYHKKNHKKPSKIQNLKNYFFVEIRKYFVEIGLLGEVRLFSEIHMLSGMLSGLLGLNIDLKIVADVEFFNFAN